MKLTSTILLELEVTGVFYNKDFTLIVIESNDKIKHCKDSTKDVKEFLIRTNETVLSDELTDYEELVYFDREYMDFYEYPIMQVLYDTYENFMKQMIPCILDYAKEHGLNYRNVTTEDWTNCNMYEPKRIESTEQKKTKLFKFLNSGARWLLSDKE